MTAKDCGTCQHLTPEGSCGKGLEGETYCLGGDYELWVGDLDAGDIEGTPVEPMGTEIFEEPSGSGINLADLDDETKQLIEDLHSGKIKPEDVPFDKREIIAKVFEAVNDRIEEIKQQQENFDNRPKNAESGFNGKLKANPTNMKTCEGCKHHSPLTGCFIKKYHDCVDNGRYLYELIPGAGGPMPSIEEELESQESIGMVDDAIKDIHVEQGKRKKSFSASKELPKLSGEMVDADELLAEILEAGKDVKMRDKLDGGDDERNPD